MAIGPRPIKPYINGVNLDDQRNSCSLVPHLTLYDQLGDMPNLGAIVIVGRGLEPVGRRAVCDRKSGSGSGQSGHFFQSGSGSGSG